jgi:hypothetical protein
MVRRLGPCYEVGRTKKTQRLTFFRVVPYGVTKIALAGAFPVMDRRLEPRYEVETTIDLFQGGALRGAIVCRCCCDRLQMVVIVPK